MDNLIFTSSPAVVRRYALRLLLCMALTDALGMMRAHRFAISTIAWNAVFMAGYLGLVLGTRTKVGSAGIQVRRAGVPAALRPWAEIASIQEETTKGGTFLLRVELADGKRFALPRPMRAPGKSDPTYDVQRDQILSCWQRMRTDPGNVT
ncbi:hypothetical protein P3T36_007451 [Kitasatospora sp. MAP12-15]|uniref:hypothetical protein n=1 Tax=unclassified Kitasatospora TaxID=2633591 RepID=UPI00247339AC|nr:hypothetical protein [Kitasatospora sp. MAP12-44]MDH6111112.1 hypothetical protein [Kitasatospora sp. MAP12-44]